MWVLLFRYVVIQCHSHVELFSLKTTQFHVQLYSTSRPLLRIWGKKGSWVEKLFFQKSLFCEHCAQECKNVFRIVDLVRTDVSLVQAKIVKQPSCNWVYNLHLKALWVQLDRQNARFLQKKCYFKNYLFYRTFAPLCLVKCAEKEKPRFFTHDLLFQLNCLWSHKGC